MYQPAELVVKPVGRSTKGGAPMISPARERWVQDDRCDTSPFRSGSSYPALTRWANAVSLRLRRSFWRWLPSHAVSDRRNRHVAEWQILRERLIARAALGSIDRRSRRSRARHVGLSNILSRAPREKKCRTTTARLPLHLGLRLLLQLPLCQGQFVGNVVLVNVADVGHGLLPDVLGRHQLHIAEPDVGI